MRFGLSLAVIATGVIWLLIVPYAFIILYSAIELQASARTIKSVDSRTATFEVVRLAKQRDRLEGSASAIKFKIGKLASEKDKKVQGRDEKLTALLRARTELRAAAIEYLFSKKLIASENECFEVVALGGCFLDRDPTKCTPDWLKTQSCYYRAITSEHMTQEDNEQILVLRKRMTDARAKGFDFNQTNIGIRDSDRELKRLEKDLTVTTDQLNKFPNGYHPAVESFRSLRKFTSFRTIFSLSQGVLLAVFTGLVAAMGAGVASLIAIYKAFEADSHKFSYYHLSVSFVMFPMLGGLTGFFVFFVVSAGASLLVNSGQLQSGDTLASLSPPTLACLGIFAGLGAKDATVWLQEKAASFFKK